MEAELRGRGHDVVAVDLPCDDDSAGLAEYADTVVDAIGDRTDLILVAHSFGGFTAPLVCDGVPVDLLFHHDTPPALAAEAQKHTRAQSATPFMKP
ncbi:alpha/beta hydrolase [Streptomyces sp. NPDC048623]|uniref:alpha/beta hydrolase n=1 Tax=Streptomyces sp. NPDC048623 TaxID=3155761 RepID=UPI00341BF8A3